MKHIVSKIKELGYITLQGTYRKLLDSPVSISNMTVNSFGHKTIFSFSVMAGLFLYFKKIQLKHYQCIIF